MSDFAIHAEGLGKRYRISQGRVPYHTLRAALTRLATAPLRMLGPSQDATPAPTDDNHIWALKDVSFEIKQGEVIGIIGRNGAGKSTLLKVLSRIIAPTEGRAEVRGRVRALLEVGTGFHPELTGRENVFLNGALLGMKRREITRLFDEIVAFSEIEKFIDTPVKYYSSGMYVRLAFAVAAHLQPEIMLVDEVLSVGDDAFQKKCLGRMDVVSKEGRTILYVSHAMGSIARLCSRTILLHDGRIVMDGPTTGVMQRYLTGETSQQARWERPESMPPSSAFRFLSATAKNDEGHACDTFRGDQAIAIAILFQVDSPMTASQVVAQVYTAMDIQLFCTADADSLNVSAIPREPGVYLASFVIPGHFLAAGRYKVSLACHMPWRTMYDFIEGALRFEVMTVGSVESLDSRKPMVAPLLAWKTEQQTP